MTARPAPAGTGTGSKATPIERMSWVNAWPRWSSATRPRKATRAAERGDARPRCSPPNPPTPRRSVPSRRRSTPTAHGRRGPWSPSPDRGPPIASSVDWASTSTRALPMATTSRGPSDPSGSSPAPPRSALRAPAGDGPFSAGSVRTDPDGSLPAMTAPTDRERPTRLPAAHFGTAARLPARPHARSRLRPRSPATWRSTSPSRSRRRPSRSTPPSSRSPWPSSHDADPDHGYALSPTAISTDDDEERAVLTFAGPLDSGPATLHLALHRHPQRQAARLLPVHLHRRRRATSTSSPPPRWSRPTPAGPSRASTSPRRRPPSSHPGRGRGPRRLLQRRRGRGVARGERAGAGSGSPPPWSCPPTSWRSSWDRSRPPSPTTWAACPSASSTPRARDP